MAKNGNLQKELLSWFKLNKRQLPWRINPSWYKTFLSEMLLQQTQVEQALPYFEKFIKRYPTIQALASAREDDILTLWAGLGYYARARNLLKAAKIIVEKFNGQFPNDWQVALSIPGVGPYSAAAILSIAFNKPYAVVDGNVYRVLSRLFIIKDDIRLNSTRKIFQNKADTLLDKTEAGNFNEAVMELGATICLPQNPLCTQCPLKDFCKAKKKGIQNQLPFKSAAAAKKLLKNYAIILRSNNQLFLRQRPAAGLLAKMWEFPTIENNNLSLENEQLKNLITKEFQLEINDLNISKQFTHIYSHIKLEYKAIIVELPKKASISLEGKWIDFSALDDFALHGAHKKLLLLLNN